MKTEATIVRTHNIMVVKSPRITARGPTAVWFCMARGEVAGGMVSRTKQIQSPVMLTENTPKIVS